MNEMNSKHKGLYWIIATIFFALTIAFGLPYIAKIVPFSFERGVAFLLPTIPTFICAKNKNLEAHQYFKQVVDRVYPIYEDDKSIPISIDVVGGSIVNAFATLGGKIYVYEALLKKIENADELAGILAHEIEHVRSRHIFQGVFARMVTIESLKFLFSAGSFGSDITSMFLNMKFSREQEAAADQGGLERLRDAKVDSHGFEQFFKRLGSGESKAWAIVSDHPSDISRAKLAQKYRGYTTEPILDGAAWKKVQTICD